MNQRKSGVAAASKLNSGSSAIRWPALTVAKYMRRRSPSPSPTWRRFLEARPARHWLWADLMRRAFDIEVLACPRCGNRMRLVATIEDPRIVEQILTHLARAAQRAGAGGPSPTASCLRRRPLRGDTRLIV